LLHRLAVLRKVLEDTANDPEFLADAGKQSLTIEFADADEMIEFYREVETVFGDKFYE
jgi:hypothetical protein